MRRAMIVFGILTMVGCQAYQPPSLAGPSPVVADPRLTAPGQCILGTSPTCITVIPTPVITPPAATPDRLDVQATCQSDGPWSMTCYLSARLNGKVWDSHIGRSSWEFGDGRTGDQGGTVASHEYPHVKREYGWGTTVTDDAGHSSYTYGAFTPKGE